MSTAASAQAPLPFDVRAMQTAATLLLALALLGGLAAVLLWALRHPAWAVGSIRVQGDVEHQNAVTFRAQLASRLSGNFLTIDLQEVKRQFEAVPWVRRAVVQREFPNRLKVTIEEHQAVAWWGSAGSGQVVNRQGEVFEANPDDSESDQWIELAGPPGQSTRVQALQRRLQPVFDTLELAIERLELSARGSWQARLDNGAVIELGRGSDDEVLARAQALSTTLTQITQRFGREIESADLRYPNGYAVRLRGITTEPADGGKKPHTKS